MEVYKPARGCGKSRLVLERTKKLLEQGYTAKEIRPGMFVFVEPESARQTWGSYNKAGGVLKTQPAKL